jgi:PKD repeat protein
MKKINTNLRLFSAWLIFLFVIIQIFTVFNILSQTQAINTTSSNESRQIGKSDMTIYTMDVSSAGMDIPDEYANEVAMIQFSDSEPIEGESIIINATVFNIGTRSASATVYFYDGPPTDKDLIGKDNLSIHALGYQIASTPWDTKSEAEFHTIYVLINPEDPENESRDDNNNATRDIIVNQIPIANTGEDLGLVDVIYEDETVMFDGTDSSDTESDQIPGLTYTWNFNDPFANSSNLNVTSGNNLTNPTHIYTHSGVYEVNLTVMDDGGAKAYDALTVKITNAEPKAHIEASKVLLDEDEEIILYATGSWDSPSDKAILEYYLNLGDGTNTGWINESKIIHSYAFEDTYTITLRVRDDDGLIDTKSLEIDVRNVPPIADAGFDLDIFESLVEFNGSGSWDTSSDIATLEYLWDFGDGEKDSGRSVIHNYAEKGKYGVKLTVTDDDGESSTDNIIVTIKNLSPVANIDVVDIFAAEDDEIIFNGSGSFDSDGEILNYNWDFGDGTSGIGMVISHKYTHAGKYLVKLLVEDDDLVFGMETLAMTIENMPPIANAGSDIEVYTGERVLLDGSNSTDTESEMTQMGVV